MSNGYIEPVTEIPKLLREFIKKKYPNYKFSVTRTNYNSINVDLFEADFDAFVTDIKNTPINPFYIQNDKNLSADAKKVMQDIYDFLSPNEYKNSGAYNFYLTMNVGRNATPYKNVGKKSYSSKGSYNSSTSNAVYDKGTLIRTCGGWELYRAMTKTNKIVYNAIKLPNTPLNKIEWDLIKGDITTQTGFKYQDGVFTKWGQIDDARINRLCELFEKYYTNQSNQIPTPTSTPTPQVIKEKLYINYIRLYELNGTLINTFVTFESINDWLKDNLDRKFNFIVVYLDGNEFTWNNVDFYWIGIENYLINNQKSFSHLRYIINPNKEYILDFDPTSATSTPTPQINTNFIIAPYYLKYIELEDYKDNDYKFLSFEDFNKNLPTKGSKISLNFNFVTTKFVYINNLIWEYESIEDYINSNYLLLNSKLTGSRKDDYIFEFKPVPPPQKKYIKDDELFNIVRKYFNQSKRGFTKKRKLELVNLNHAHAIIEVKRLNNANIMDETYQYYIEPSTNKSNQIPTSTPTPTSKVLTKADFERRIKGLELLLKNTNNTLEIIKYNKKIKGLKLLIKNS